MTLQELHRQYFEYYSDLYEAKMLLPHRQYEVMVKAIYNDYCNELDIVVGEKQLEVGRFMYELKFKLRNYLPKRMLLISNKVAKVMTKQLKAAFLKELEAMQQGSIAQPPEEQKPELPARPGS